MTQRSKVGYALPPDGYHIAYADLGHGDICHVFMAEFVSVVDEIQWQHPALVRFERLYASLSRVVYIDLRGIGLSDGAPLDDCFAPEARATDILAVLDALEVERAVISGEGYSGHAATQFAVTYPERTLRLALNNSYAHLGHVDGDDIVQLSAEEVADMGEVELLPDGDLRGIAVHAAARLCDAAGPHEVLVSRIVADLAAGSDFRFQNRGPHDLKGVPGSWTLYEVTK